MTIALKTLALTLLASGAVVLPGVASPPPQLIWNASASVPIGLYSVQPEPEPKVPDIVVVRPPEALVGFLSDGGYLPRGVPLLKHVAAVGGQRICRMGAAVSIDGMTVGEALGHDRRGRPLPVWQGCTILAADQVFLFNADRPDSLDGRYFGPLSRTTIVGRAQPIWTRSGD
jgi:conjugative transfer signal peptidase TraF